jgi:hypothetical protein
MPSMSAGERALVSIDNCYAAKHKGAEITLRITDIKPRTSSKPRMGSAATRVALFADR